MFKFSERSLPVDEDITHEKLKIKVDRHYSDIGKMPGVLIEENKRRKLLQDLGVS